MPIDCNRVFGTEAHFITDGIRRCYEARALKSLQYGYSDALINRISDFSSDNKDWSTSIRRTQHQFPYQTRMRLCEHIDSACEKKFKSFVWISMELS
ncbi:hypothetical protein L2E82_31888 [Cichorium intybus]|uniref:Uncharacterized protein n=1 Tax=Cichorium intybus TaxID=13427 RepID=A0ACB9BFA2_CICIN|nr:hypothetical protein L2E82_31888 [Cichorium intybus]